MQAQTILPGLESGQEKRTRIEIRALAKEMPTNNHHETAKQTQCSLNMTGSTAGIKVTMPKTMPLYEQYRPRTWADVVGQDKVLNKVQILAKRGLSGRAFWLSGKSGTGKTTIARILAAEIADDLFISEIDASDLTIARLKDVEHEMHLSAMGKGGRAYIVNEAHGLRRDTVRQLLVLLERLPSHVMVIFTTTIDGESLFEDLDDSHPLLSRCVRLPLSQRGLAQAFAEKCHTIATKEGLNGRQIKDYVRLANDNQGNFRAMLQAIEAGEMIG